MPPELATRHFTTKVLLSFAALYTIWGSTYYAIQLAGKSVPPLLMAGTRFLVAGSILLAWCWASGTIRRSDFTRRTWGAAAIVGLGLMLIGNGGVAIAVQRIPTGISAVIVALTPMWLVLFDWAQQRGRRPSNAVFLGIAFGVTGIATLKLADGGGEGQLDLVGILINIVATIGWAFGSIWGRTAARAASPVTACAMQMLAGGAILLVVSPFFESWSTVRIGELSAEFWLSWAYLIVFGSLCGFTAYIWLLQHVSAAKVGTYAYVNPIVALLIGMALNGERFTATQALACGLILAGVMVITLFRTTGAAKAAVSEDPAAEPSLPTPKPKPMPEPELASDATREASSTRR